MLTTSSSATASQVCYAYGKVRSYTGSFPTRYQFTGQHIDDSDLTYMNARYYDPVLGQFISPDTLVPDAGLLVDYNRYGYARGNPLKFSDPSGHCATLSSGEADLEGDGECWQLAYQIYGFSSRESFARDWKISGDEWLEKIAKEKYADVEHLKPFAEQYYTEWAREVGLPVDKVVWHEPPRQPVFPLCETVDCGYAAQVALDVASLALSHFGDAALVACAVATEGACLAAGLLKLADGAVTLGSTGYGMTQWMSGNASDLDLAVTLTDFAVSVVPIGGEVSGWVVLLYDVTDPIIIDDDMNWGSGIVK